MSYTLKYWLIEMKNTFGELVKTRKLWESGWAIGERKKTKNLGEIQMEKPL